MHPWILNDLDDPQKWLQMTCHSTKINVSVHEASGAMSAVHFRWRWGGKIAKHITSVFRNVRPVHRSPGMVATTKSDPYHRFQFNKDVVGTTSSQLNERDKGKWKATGNSEATRDYPQSSPGTLTSYAGSQQFSAAKACRGTNSLGRETSALSSKSGSEKRSRFGLFLNWRPTNSQSPPTTPSSSFTQSPSPRTLGTINGGNHPNSRRSEEALRFIRHTQGSVNDDDDECGRLTAARRASSWGQGDKELHEVVSVTSVERELNDHDMNVGAGGVSRDGELGIGVGGSSSFHLFDSILSGGGGSGGVREEMFADVNERYGRPFYDEDSSTLASGPGDDEGDDDDWQHGSEFDDDDADGEGALDSDEENGVTFSPRRRPLDLDQ